MRPCVAGRQRGTGNPLLAAASIVSPLALGRKIAVFAACGRNRGHLKFSGLGISATDS